MGVSVNRERIKELVLDGYCVEFRNISICCITDYYKHKGMWKNYAFQVHVDHHRVGGTVSEIDENIDKSLQRFFELKGKCYGRQKED